jgi:hypothetical protein
VDKALAATLPVSANETALDLTNENASTEFFPKTGEFDHPDPRVVAPEPAEPTAVATLDCPPDRIFGAN